MKKYYTVKEIADLLEISQYRVRKLIHNGWLKAERGPRRKFLVTESALFAYAYHGPKYRTLLFIKLGMKFRMYMLVRNIQLAVKNMYERDPERFERILRKAEALSERKETQG